MAIKKTVNIPKDCYMIYPNGVKIADTHLAKLVFSHMRLKDILNPFRIMQASLEVSSMLGSKNPKILNNKFNVTFK